MPPPAAPPTWRLRCAQAALAIGSGSIYFLSNADGSPYDYTFRIAGALLDGRLGLQDPAPSWLNEMVPLDGSYYSVFPLGSVLVMLPLASLKAGGIIDAFPASIVVAVTAAIVSVLFYLLTLRYDVTGTKRWLVAAVMMFGTWMWCNLALGGAWQIALGLSVLGQLAALYFVIVARKPLAAGFFFALAFGNRTETVLLAPIFLYLVCRGDVRSARDIPRQLPAVSRFSVFPLLLGVATLAYNYLRFGSPWDFGYARIPGVLEEPWYANGIFSIRSIVPNMKAMLFESWKTIEGYPYLTPTGFGGSILLSSPFLLLLFRRGAKELSLKVIAWIAIVILTAVLWLHGNPGGWQFSYRYAMILLPWMFIILLESAPPGVTRLEIVLFAASVAVNAYATYLFLWTDYVRP